MPETGLHEFRLISPISDHPPGLPYAPKTPRAAEIVFGRERTASRGLRHRRQIRQQSDLSRFAARKTFGFAKARFLCVKSRSIGTAIMMDIRRRFERASCGGLHLAHRRLSICRAFAAVDFGVREPRGPRDLRRCRRRRGNGYRCCGGAAPRHRDAWRAGAAGGLYRLPLRQSRRPQRAGAWCAACSAPSTASTLSS